MDHHFSRSVYVKFFLRIVYGIAGFNIEYFNIPGAAKKKPPYNFCSFLKIGWEFQGKMLHAHVVIRYVHIGINSI